MDIIKSIEHEQMKNKIPELKVGNTVRVHVRVKEGNRQRIQVFEGTIIKVQGGGVNQTFTVRRISYGVGVEKTFLVHSPNVEKVEVTRVGKARRAKLFYLRQKLGKAAKTKEKVGARIETKEIVLKEEKVEVPETEAEVVEELAPAEEAPVVEKETVKEEAAEVKTEPKVEETVKEEKVVEEVKEEQKAEPTVEPTEGKTESAKEPEEKEEEPVKEEIKEEPAEKETEPVKEEKVEEKVEEETPAAEEKEEAKPEE